MKLLNDYWANRATERAAQNYNRTKEYLKFLEKLFYETQMDIDKQIFFYLSEMAERHGTGMPGIKKKLNKKELEAFKVNWEEFLNTNYKALSADGGRQLKKMEDVLDMYNISRLQALELQIVAEINKLYGQFFLDTEKLLEKEYRTIFREVNRELNVINLKDYKHMQKLSSKVVKKAIYRPWAPDGRAFSSRIWSNKEKVVKELHLELSRSLMLGENPRKTGKRLAKKLNTAESAAYRLANTEMSNILSSATYDGYKEHGIEKYKIVAYIDNRTSEICREMNGKVFYLKDKKTGVNYPPFHPHCRTTTVPVLRTKKELIEATKRAKKIFKEGG